MERLIASNMIYGGLMEVSQPHLVKNYNTALTQFGFKPIAPKKFYIDAMGFSPQIAEILEDQHYLNPHRVNPRFIILTPKQHDLPYTQVSFSSTPELMRSFYEANRSSLDILTLKDVIFGEIEDDTYTVTSIEDLLSIRHVMFDLNSANGVLEAAHKLEGLVSRFEREPTSWDNDTLIKEIIDLAALTGDIRKNDPVPRNIRFTKNAFWADHFGGVYILRDDDEHMVLAEPEEPPFPTKKRALDWYISLADPKTLHTYLDTSERLEPLNRDWLLDSGVLESRIDQHIGAMMALSGNGADLGRLTPANVKKWVNAHASDVSNDRILSFLNKTKKSLVAGDTIDLGRVAPDLRFSLQRAMPNHPDAGLINRLIAEYVPFDFVVRFMVNKEAFYRDYETYPNNLRDYVVALIEDTYFSNKERYWQKVFGEYDAATKRPKKGPWG